MPVALQDQLVDFFPLADGADIERDPAVVAEVRRNAISRVRGQQALSIHAYPKTQRELLAVMSCRRKGLLARLPDRVAKLTFLVRLRKPKAELSKSLKHCHGPRRFHGVDLAGG